jgi:hypothetical protein
VRDLKFEFEFKKKPQSIDCTKPPRSCVGSEPGDALKGHREDSEVLLLDLLQKGMVGWDEKTTPEKCSDLGEKSMVQS